MFKEEWAARELKPASGHRDSEQRYRKPADEPDENGNRQIVVETYGKHLESRGRQGDHERGAHDGPERPCRGVREHGYGNGERHGQESRRTLQTLVRHDMMAAEP